MLSTRLSTSFELYIARMNVHELNHMRSGKHVLTIQGCSSIDTKHFEVGFDQYENTLHIHTY